MIGIRGNNTGYSSSFSRAPSDHQLGSGRYFFFWPEKKCHIIHSNWCLMPTLASLGLSRCGVFWMMHRPVFLQQFFSITCLLFPLPACCLSVSFLCHFSSSFPALSSPPFLMKGVCIWAWELSGAMAVPSLHWRIGHPHSPVISPAQPLIRAFTGILM